MTTHRTIVSLIASLCVVCAARADSVTLRATARVEPNSPITLGDVARLDGPLAMRLAGLVVLDSLGDAAVADGALAGVTLGQVQRVIKQDGRVSLGRVELRGGRCVLLARNTAQPIGAKTESSAPAPAAIEGTVRARVERTIRETFGVAPEDLRIGFRASDEALLATPIAGRTVSVRVIGRSSRLPLGVMVYQGERIVASGSVRATVSVRRTVVVAAGLLRRGDRPVRSRLRVEQRWVEPTLQPAPLDRVLASAVRTTVHADEPIELAHIESPVLIERGEIVVVHCVAGTILIEQRARAKSPGRDGQIITFESLDEPRRLFTARVSGPGRAVVVAGFDQAHTDAQTESTRHEDHTP